MSDTPLTFGKNQVRLDTLPQHVCDLSSPFRRAFHDRACREGIVVPSSRKCHTELRSQTQILQNIRQQEPHQPTVKRGSNLMRLAELLAVVNLSRSEQDRMACLQTTPAR